MILTVIMMILPMILAVGIQYLTIFGMLFSNIFGVAFTSASSGESPDIASILEQAIYGWLDNTENLMMASLVYAVITSVVMWIWYSKTKSSNYGTKAVRQKIDIPKIAVGIVLIAITMQQISSYISILVGIISPETIEAYNRLMEEAGLTSDNITLAVFLYTVIFGPLAEELTFRGVIMKIGLKKMPFIAVNIIQALLFGIYHMNPLQGIYTFCFGLCLGYVAYRTKGIKASYFLHLVFNLSAVMQAVGIGDNPFIILVGVVASFALLYLGINLVAMATGAKSIED
ncbi:MAG: CPBP family intramembrane metalloprotease [Lachnospiraceae bacterium]|nr:CPBP family intramembrane metalloprotease [Lachnospiraceae bacterium]